MLIMVLDNNQNNILPYRSRLLQMSKVEIQGLFTMPTLPLQYIATAVHPTVNTKLLKFSDISD